MAEVLSERLLTRVPFRDLGFSPLFCDYCDAVPEAVSFFGNHFLDTTAIARARQSASRLNPRTRKVLVEVLAEQNASWNAPSETLRNIDQLYSEQTTCVVTGQQLGLFVSPLYTIYKSLTTLQLAAKWSRPDSPVVPLFWLADEDHDLAEIAPCYVPSGDRAPVEIRYPEISEHNLVPTGYLVTDDAIVDAIDKLKDVLPVSADADAIVVALRDCYQPGTRYADAFARFLHFLLPDSGLIVLSAGDARLKQLGIPLFRKAIEDCDDLHRTMVESSASIARKYHAQLHLRNTNLFVISDDSRIGLDRVDNGFEVKGSGDVLSTKQVLDRLYDEPEAFSPNVVLRPIYQDSILPTIAYVGGPGEVAYFAQIRSAYDWAKVSMPVIYPRASLSLVDGSASRLLSAHDLQIPDLQKQPETLFGELVARTMSLDVENVVGAARARLDAVLEDLQSDASNVESTLASSVEAIRVTLGKRLSRLEKKIVREEKRKHALLGDRVGRTTSFLFPNGKPQERIILPAYFAARFGRDYFVRLLLDLDSDTSTHFVLRA